MLDRENKDNKYKAILVDFDGVLRQWPSSDIVIERKYGLAENTIRTTAFEKNLLEKAIRGIITDEEWRSRIVERLQIDQPESDTLSAINEWTDCSGTIDTDLLNLLACCKPEAGILLLTNATSRLNEDLKVLGLDDWFAEVINSSDLGSIKPEPEIYMKAIQACNCSVDNVVYIDDSMKNTLAATQLGISSYRYTDVTECKHYLSRIGFLR